MTRYEVLFLPQAIGDLDALYLYIAQETSFESADCYLARIERQCLALASFPKRGTAVQGKLAGLRTMGFERRATVLFRVGQDKVEILRILHHGRDVDWIIEQTPQF